MFKRMIAMAVVGGALIALLIISQHRNPPLKVSGFIEADEIRVGSRVGGRVKTVSAIEGQTVKVNDSLIELEPYDLLARHAESVAKLEQARAQQQLAQITFDRIKPAYERNAASHEEMDTAAAQLKAAQAATESVDATVKALDEQIKELKIVAPVNGRVEAVDLQPGDLVAANAPVLSLMDTSNLWVRVYLPENHLDVQVGQKLEVTVDSFPNRKFTGHVSFVARQAEFTPGNVQTPEERSKQVFRMKVTLDEGLDVLHPGMSADVWLNTKAEDKGKE
ncbi:MAG TPA: efflux RND transporter periplasmic adaptor subunit [Tepidisphaeraceae bacterium]|nr:efflux RND transporter periplasmic adaptor subunit [Tepidisphaeraceae bacterium]